MYRNSSITNFFKPFAHSRQNKRPLSEDNINGPRPLRGSHSITPEAATRAETLPEAIRPPNQTPSPNDPPKVGGAPADRPLSPKHDSLRSGSRGRLKPSREERKESPGLQGHISAGSQRVMRDGKVMIRNSDDESESDMSLDDIDDLLVARRNTLASSPPTEPDHPQAPPFKQEEISKPVVEVRISRSTRAKATYLPSTLPVVPKYKFSLKALEEKAKDDKASEVGSSKAKLLLDSFEQEKIKPTDKARRVDKAGEKFDAEFVSAVLKDKGDEEGINRLMTAIERTEAFHQGKIWSFFSIANDPTLLQQAKFPVLDDVHWQGILTSLSASSLDSFRQLTEFRYNISAAGVSWRLRG